MRGRTLWIVIPFSTCYYITQDQSGSNESLWFDQYFATHRSGAVVFSVGSGSV